MYLLIIIQRMYSLAPIIVIINKQQFLSLRIKQIYLLIIVFTSKTKQQNRKENSTMKDAATI